MEEVIEFGKVYFIKDGEVIEKKLHTTKKQLLDIVKSYDRTIISQITSIEETKENPSIIFDILEIYKPLLDKGFSIIRVAHSFEFRHDEYGNLIDIIQVEKTINSLTPEKIDKPSYYQIYKTFEKESRDVVLDKQYIYNINQHGENFDYDYLDSRQTNKNYTMLEKLDVLLREKINALDPNEKDMIQAYRNYDLESILTVNQRENKINHGNAGSIVITPDRTYEKTLTKLQHGEEFRWCLENAKLADKGVTGPVITSVEATNSIVIQLCYGEAILWLNPEENRTKYQQSELERILKEMTKIKENGFDLDIEAAICQNSSFSSINYQDIIKDEEKETKKRA